MSFERSSPASAQARPSATVLHFPSTRRTGAVRVWLWAVAATIFLMVLVGGATRLTESGLSITEWEPLFGAIPPLTAAAWAAKFEAYKQIPQFALHPDMTLGEFRQIFFWEWSHRLIGRALGLVIALPLAFFWWRGRLTRRLKAQAVGLLVLVGIQGAVGWWMVKSGLVDRTEVS
ncbi:MAG: COX15/CtaA family protein, partial [Caulobacteraceae bacterium]|nr:COX15/CtaA family protein [Caulobacter sp.]